MMILCVSNTRLWQWSAWQRFLVFNPELCMTAMNMTMISFLLLVAVVFTQHRVIHILCCSIKSLMEMYWPIEKFNWHPIQHNKYWHFQQTVNHHWVMQNVQCMWKSFQMTYKNKAQQKVSKSCRNTFTHQVTHTQIKQIFHTLGYSKSSAIYTALLQATYTQSSTLTDTVPDIHTVSHPHWAQQKVIHT